MKFENLIRPGADASASEITVFNSLDDIAQIPSLKPTRGTWFDEAVDLRQPEGNALTATVLTRLANAETRVRKRHADAQRNHETLVRKILANVFRCFFHREPWWVTYNRKADSYQDKPSWLSGKAMARTVDALAGIRLLDTRLGERGASSVYQVTQDLFGLASGHAVTSDSITHRLSSDRLVRLRRSNAKSPLVDFTPTHETLRWTSQLEDFNAFVEKQDIRISLSHDEEREWVNQWNRDPDRKGAQLYRPELFQTDLYRQFNNGTFDEGGRLYGGWWINTPKALRRKITINGNETVELDFSGHAIRMLYNERGIDYRDDPYEIGAITAFEQRKGLPLGHFRDSLKAMLQALINDRHGRCPERIQLPPGRRFTPHFKRREIRKLIEEKHGVIADAFGTGAGLRLQRADSDLALDIILRLKDQQIVTLPIHDSFIVPVGSKERLELEMKESYKSKFLFDPIIK